MCFHFECGCNGQCRFCERTLSISVANPPESEHDVTYYDSDMVPREVDNPKERDDLFDPTRCRAQKPILPLSLVRAFDYTYLPRERVQELKERHQPHTALAKEIPLFKLAPGEAFKAELTVRKGCGKLHAKWSPAAQCTYRFMPNIRLDPRTLDAASQEQRDMLVASCPVRCITTDPATGAVRVTPEDALRCIYCLECCQSHPSKPDGFPYGAVHVDPTPNDFIFELESSGSLPVRAVLTEGLKQVRDRAEMVKVGLRQALADMEVKEEAEQVGFNM
eukprot:gnl/Ergobibamus_cyprinoides/713.p1 GENE.gnl/Ergobibamus_cyprinoides/713~~gnl/Ergobibamus_cyprinoides/713.p1  ORF type:complete len:277 (+),score=73.78 gnl/Ergobibamus_cyprinoides/713:318-1148(+)